MPRATRHALFLILGLLGIPSGGAAQAPPARGAGEDVFRRENLVAWCIVPFDAKRRGPEERAAMLERLGFKRFAYDWRAEHVPQFDAELEALARHGIRLDAFWFPAELNAEARAILAVLARHKTPAQLWVTMGDPAPAAKTQEERLEAAARAIRPLAAEAAKFGGSVGLYNHGGWFGQPENQIALIERLKLPNVGIVYNLHHGHEHLDRFPGLLKKMLPHLHALNLNGMDRGGDAAGRKILPLGQGALDLELLRAIRASGYRGPIGILGHTMDDAEERLRDNLDGLDWLLPQLEGKPAGPRPKPRTPVGEAKKSATAPPAPREDPALPAKSTPQAESAPEETSVGLSRSPGIAPRELAAVDGEYNPELVAQVIAEARESGDARRGAEVFAAPELACLSCHRVGAEGGIAGPELSNAAVCLSPEQIVEALLWPARTVKEGYAAEMVLTSDGAVHQGYLERESETEIVLRDPGTGESLRLARTDVAERRAAGTLMPGGLATAMTPARRRDLVRFLLELGRTDGLAAAAAGRSHAPASFPFDRAPLRPDLWPGWQEPVNRDRLYDFYAKEADYFRAQASVPPLLPQFPGLDGGRFGHWGNQNEDTWRDDRWSRTDFDTLLCGVFRGAGVTVPKGVCVRLGERGELAACFNPETLTYDAVWRGGFVRLSPVRHGFMDGLLLDGEPLPRSAGRRPEKPFVYRGFYRHGRRVIFSYSIGGTEYLDAPWAEGGEFTRAVAPAAEHPLASLTRGGPPRWPEVLETRGTLGRGGPYAADTIPPPLDNPWRALFFFGGHDFLPDGSAMLCTITGDVWRADGLDGTLARVRWRRFASGLHQPLGLVVAAGEVYVLGRDQITRLADLDADGEADFHECVTNAHETSSAGHDFICGLERDAAGRFYTASGNQGLLRLDPAAGRVEVLATGFRNPDGLGLLPDGSVTVPCSEGEWTPASMVCLVRPPEKTPAAAAGTAPDRTAPDGTAPDGGRKPPHFGHGGPRDGEPPALPLVYLPRGLDNSSGGQIHVSSARWGPLRDQVIHFSSGACAAFLLLRGEAGGQPQGAAVPLAGELLSGVHRGRFHPLDGQLYVTGMNGWGAYARADGSFQRLRYTGEPVQLPRAFETRENGVLVSFTRPVERATAADPRSHFAQAWNYRYGAGYGSPELSPRHRGAPGHDPLAIASAHVLADGATLFLEIPELQPVNQLHLRLRVDAAEPQDIYATVHRLGPAFADFPGYRPTVKTIAAHPLLADLSSTARPAPNPWQGLIPEARSIKLEAGKNLTFATRSFTARAGEALALTLANPDVVPHNWVLVRRGALERVGDLVNRIVAEPDAAARQYVPRSRDVLVYTDVVHPGEAFTVYFHAPREKGRYPYLCSFPGHWMVMNGQMVVE